MSIHLNENQANALARAIQSAFPLERNPYEALGDELGLEPGTILAQLQEWRHEQTLREISAVLEGEVLGWDSALVAGSVPADRIDQVAAVVSAHPTVTHNYEREHRYNLWFTIAVPPGMNLEQTLALLAAEAGVERFLPLRRTATFKIGVNFDLERLVSLTEQVELGPKAQVDFGERERRLCRALQTPLPLVGRPFAALAEAFGSDEAELLAFAREQLGGAMRRYIATFRHRKLGVGGNGMAVWNLSLADQAALGPRLAAAPEVSHCYARNTIEGFPYNTYAMIHGRDRDSVLEVAARLADELQAQDYLVLFSTREFKKTRLRYFLPELDAWWAERTQELSV